MNKEKVVRAFELVNSLIEEYSKNISEDLALFIEAEKRFGVDWKSKLIKSNFGSVNIKEYPCYYSVKKDTLVNAFGNVLYRKGIWAKEQDSYKPYEKVSYKEDGYYKADLYSHFDYDKGLHVLISGIKVKTVHSENLIGFKVQ